MSGLNLREGWKEGVEALLLMLCMHRSLRKEGRSGGRGAVEFAANVVHA
jgi:hypothetical protein